MTDTTTDTARDTTDAATSPPGNLPLVPGLWALDTTHVNAGFTIRHLGVAKVRGRFARVEAELLVGDTLDETSVTATIDLASIDTGNADRDAHVLAPDLLDVERRPTLAFRSTGVRSTGDDWVLDGELTIGEVTRPFALDVDFGGVADYIDGTRRAGFEATGELRRKEFGLDFGPIDVALGAVVRVELDLEFVEPTA